MHGATIKMVNAQQAKLKNNYKNTKLKLLKTNAAIWFNKCGNIFYITDMLPQHQVNIKKLIIECFFLKNVTLARNSVAP